MNSLLQAALEQSLQKVSGNRLQREYENLSKGYRKHQGSKSLFETEEGCLAYLTTRMPATYGAVDCVLEEMKRRFPDWQGKSLLDLGAGPGTASWAALDHFSSIQELLLIDQSKSMIEWGKRLAVTHPVLSKAEWMRKSLIEASLPKKDLSILSYALGEVEKPLQVIEKVWSAEIPLLIVLEPGTPVGFDRILKVRDFWLKLGGHIVSPCPHSLKCPMQNNDWCHFSARIQRTSFHRMIKGGSLGHEDEKFCYLILSRTPVGRPSNRIVRHPLKGKGHIQLELCTQGGEIQNKTITRKENELYRLARDAKWGDEWM